MLASVSLLRVSNLAKAKHRGKAELFRGAWTGQRNHRKLSCKCLLNSKCPIWRKPNTEEKRSFFEVAWTGQRNRRQACLQASPYCERTIWRKPDTEEKRSFFEVGLDGPVEKPI